MGYFRFDGRQTLRVGCGDDHSLVGIGNPRIGDERQAEITEHSSYFRTEVLHGPGAFLEVALGYKDYARAMSRKLFREVSVPPLGSLPRPLAPPGRRVASAE